MVKFIPSLEKSFDGGYTRSPQEKKDHFSRLMRDKNYLLAANCYFENPKLHELISNETKDDLISGLYEMVLKELHSAKDLPSI